MLLKFTDQLKQTPDKQSNGDKIMVKINKTLKNKNGFTLIEIIVVLAVIAALAAVLTPMVINYIADANLRRAEADVKAIGAAMGALLKDTSVYPGDAASGSSIIYLVSDGTLPDDPGGGAISAATDTLYDHLMVNNRGYPTTGKREWKGPYLESLDADSYGISYLVYMENFKKGSTFKDATSWVLSAGPDKTLDTTGSTSTSGDDIGYRIK